MSLWFLDIETYSEADLKKVGAHKYAEHPTTEIILLAIAKEDGPVELWDQEVYWPFGSANTLLREMVADDGPIWAHNAGFEIPLLNARLEVDLGFKPPALERWRCTAAMCRRVAIPWSLKDAAVFLGLTNKKADLGAALIKYFSVPKGKDKKPPEGAWRSFGDYCRQDVEVCREIYRRLHKHADLDRQPGYFIDLRLNERGVPVNIDALLKAETLVDQAMAELAAEFQTLTGGLKHTQRNKVLEWLQARGYPAQTLKSATMEEILDQPPPAMGPDALRALELRAGGSFAALAKIPAMRGAACADGRVRGAFLWSGALRTHRWSGRLIQAQNYRRPTISDTDLAYTQMKAGLSAEHLDLLFAPIPEVLASCIRHFIELEGEMLIECDYSAIEARVLPWLFGQDDLLGEFRAYDASGAKELEPYRLMASLIFNVPPGSVTKDQRWVGKTGVLSCGYGTGWRKFQTMCAMSGKDLPEELCRTVIERYRAKNDKIVNGWWECETAARNALRQAKKTFTAGRVTFRYGAVGGFPALVATLPSRHRLIYPHPKIERITREFDGKKWEEEALTYYGKEQFQTKWGRRVTWGSALCENLSQACAGDFLVHGLEVAESKGYEPFMVVHDQALCIQNGKSAAGFRDALCTLPPWAPDFPLVAEYTTVPRYTKS